MLNTAISRLAYEFYTVSGCAEGRDVENWLKAERFLKDVLGGMREQDPFLSFGRHNKIQKKKIAPKVSTKAASSQSASGLPKKPAGQSPRKGKGIFI